MDIYQPSSVTSPSLMAIDWASMFLGFVTSLTASPIPPSGLGIKSLSIISTVHVSGSSQIHPRVIPAGLLNSLDNAEPVAFQQRSKVLTEAICSLIACLYNRSRWRGFFFETTFLPSVHSSRTASPRVTFSYPREGSLAAKHTPVDHTIFWWNAVMKFLIIWRRDIVYCWNTFKCIGEDLVTSFIHLIETTYLWIALASNLSMESLIVMTNRLTVYCLIYSTQQPRTWVITEVAGFSYTQTIYRCAHVLMACLVWMVKTGPWSYASCASTNLESLSSSVNLFSFGLWVSFLYKHSTAVFLLFAGLFVVLQLKVHLDCLFLEASHNHHSFEFRQMLRHDEERWMLSMNMNR